MRPPPDAIRASHPSALSAAKSFSSWPTNSTEEPSASNVAEGKRGAERCCDELARHVTAIDEHLHADAIGPLGNGTAHSSNGYTVQWHTVRRGHY